MQATKTYEVPLGVVPPLAPRVLGDSSGKLTGHAGRRRASVFSSPLDLCVSSARRWIRLLTGLPRHEASCLELVVSELLANAINHSASGDPGRLVTVRVAFLDASLIRIAVSDRGPKSFGIPGFPSSSRDALDAQKAFSGERHEKTPVSEHERANARGEAPPRRNRGENA